MPKSYLKANIPSPRPTFQSQGIWASRLGVGLEAEIWAWRRRRKRRRRKFLTCVKAKVIDPFWPAALPPPSTTVETYLIRAWAPLTIKCLWDYSTFLLDHHAPTDQWTNGWTEKKPLIVLRVRNKQASKTLMFSLFNFCSWTNRQTDKAFHRVAYLQLKVFDK